MTTRKWTTWLHQKKEDEWVEFCDLMHEMTKKTMKFCHILLESKYSNIIQSKFNSITKNIIKPPLNEFKLWISIRKIMFKNMYSSIYALLYCFRYIMCKTVKLFVWVFLKWIIIWKYYRLNFITDKSWKFPLKKKEENLTALNSLLLHPKNAFKLIENQKKSKQNCF